MSVRKINLLHVVGGFKVGGSERQQAELVKRLPGDYRQTVVTMEKAGPFLAEVEAAGAEVIECPFTSFYNANAVRQYRRLAKLVRERKIDIVHCHNFYSNVFGAVAMRFGGFRKLITSRRDFGTWFSRSQLLVQRLAYGFSAAIVANSQATKQMLVEKERVPAKRIRCVYNGIDVKKFKPREASAPLAVELGIDLQRPVVGMVGSLHPWKGQDVFLRAAATIAKEIPQAQFLLVGDGEERENLAAQARELGIKQAVIFAGARKDIPDVLALIDVFVLSSPTESLPNAVLEAMACALPVVATAVGGIPELITEGENGYLFAPGDDAALAAHVLRILQQPNAIDGMGEAGRRRVLADFSCERMIENMQAVYETVLKLQSFNRIEQTA